VIDHDQEQLAKLIAGDEITVQGTCTGRVGSGDSFTVFVEHCTLIGHRGR
jgi:hypothetical protein